MRRKKPNSAGFMSRSIFEREAMRRALAFGLCVLSLVASPLRPIAQEKNKPATVFPVSATAGQVLISEFRFCGNGSAGDEFVELYNNTEGPLDISGYTVWALTSEGVPDLRFTAPGAPGSSTTTIPARGHFLMTGSAYSLGAVAPSDGSLTAGIVESSGIGLFAGATPTAETRSDSAGFDSRNPLFFEGSIISSSVFQSPSGICGREISLLRRYTPTGLSQDSGNNNVDFLLIATLPFAFISRPPFIIPTFGAPGPEGLTSPVFKTNASFPSNLLDPAQSMSSAPNRVRTQRASCPSCDDTKSNLGTLELRKKFTNNTGAPVTRLRFRIIDITAPNNTSQTGEADMRVLSASGNFTVLLTDGGGAKVERLTLEAPSDAVIYGGGLNSTLAAGTITTVTPIANGASINVNFLLGVQQSGYFRFIVVVEALP